MKYEIVGDVDMPEVPTVYATALTKEAAGEKLVELLKPLLEDGDFCFLDSSGRYESLEKVLSDARENLNGSPYFVVVPIPD